MISQETAALKKTVIRQVDGVLLTELIIFHVGVTMGNT